jgi:hypothetical protein
MTNCAGHRITGGRNKNPQCQNSSKTMAITTKPIPTLSLDELNQLTSSVTDDTTNWGTVAGWTTTGTVVPGYGAAPGGGTGYTYTTTGTGTGTGSIPWISNGGTNPAMVVNQSGTIEIKGEDADIKINDKSMVSWMEAVEERLNLLTPNPKLEAEWDELQELGERYRALERKCKEKAQMWAALKKVQPKQP